MPEPSHRQLSRAHPHAFAIGIHDVRTGPSHADELGECVLLRTDRGDIQAILHQAPEAQMGGVCGPVHGVHLWNRWTGPRNAFLSTALEEEVYVDRSGGVCALYVCRV